MSKMPRHERAVCARASGRVCAPLSLAVLGIETFELPVNLPFWIFQAVWTVFMVILWWWGCRVLRRESRRPDYAAIAALEWSIWGHAFEHAGALRAAAVPPTGPVGPAWACESLMNRGPVLLHPAWLPCGCCNERRRYR